MMYRTPKVAIYCRLSEEDKNKLCETDDSNSIQNQKAMLIQYSLAQGWEIYNIYSDDDFTGSDRNRPEFKRLLADAEDKKFDIILCKTQSRFTRELELVEKYIHGLFLLWNIRFVSIVDNADTDNKGNKKSRQINGLVNEWYLEDMSDNIRSVLNNRRENGFHIGSFAPYGYKKDTEHKGHLIIDNEAAAVVREVFSLFAQGYGKTAIARMLNDRDIPNPTEYKRRKGLNFKLPPSKQSTLWKYFAISDMLTNEVYVGNMVQGKYGSVSYKTKISRPRPKSEWYRVEGTHEPIIDRALWDQVQILISERAKPFKVGTVGLFAKKARCAYCGYIMRSSKSGGRRYLQCPNRHYSKGACPGSFISVDKLERMVIDELQRLSAKYLDRDVLVNEVRICDTLAEKKIAIEGDISAYQHKNRQYTKGVRDLYLDKVKGIISETDFIMLSQDFYTQKERLEAHILDLQKRLDDIESTIAIGVDRHELINQYVNAKHLSRFMVEMFVDKIMVGKRIEGTRIVPIEIHWNF